MGLVFNPLDVQGITGPSVSASNLGVVKALLAKHAAMKAPGGGDAPPVAPTATAPPAPAPAAPAMTAPPGAPPAAPDPINIAPPPDFQTSGPDALANATAPDIKKPGMLDRVGDFLKSDEGRATMLRFAAGAFNGGIGGGLNAATSFTDQRRAEAAAAARFAAEQAMKTKELDTNANLGFGRIGVDAARTAAEAGHWNRQDNNEAGNIESQNWRHTTPSGDVVVQAGTTRYTHDTPSGDTVTTTGEKQYEHDHPSADTVTSQQGANYRHDTASGDTRLNVQEKTAPKIQLHARYQTTPGEFQQDGPRLRLPSQVKPAAPGQQAPVRVANDDDYNAIPSGKNISFIGPDGQLRVKP